MLIVLLQNIRHYYVTKLLSDSLHACFVTKHLSLLCDKII